MIRDLLCILGLHKWKWGELEDVLVICTLKGVSFPEKNYEATCQRAVCLHCGKEKLDYI
jgi:hypothetical protein